MKFIWIMFLYISLSVVNAAEESVHYEGLPVELLLSKLADSSSTEERAYLAFLIGKAFKEQVNIDGVSLSVSVSDLRNARKWLETSMERGYRPASFLLSDVLFLEGEQLYQVGQFKDAYSTFLHASEISTNAKADYRLYEMTYKGLGTRQDRDKALALLQKAAYELNSEQALITLARAHMNNEFGKENSAALAIHWANFALAIGLDEAKEILAPIYILDDKHKDYKQGCGFAAGLAMQGNVEGFYLSAHCDDFGLVDDSNKLYAIEMYEKAAKLGHKAARQRLLEIKGK